MTFSNYTQLLHEILVWSQEQRASDLKVCMDYLSEPPVLIRLYLHIIHGGREVKKEKKLFMFKTFFQVNAQRDLQIFLIVLKNFTQTSNSYLKLKTSKDDHVIFYTKSLTRLAFRSRNVEDNFYFSLHHISFSFKI